MRLFSKQQDTLSFPGLERFPKWVQLLFRKETLAPILALLFASATSVLIVVARMWWTERLRYAFLAFNLLLAWLPLVFGLLARDSLRTGQRPGWRFFGWSAAWLLFFPNAPYIFTDLIHLKSHYFDHFWVDLMLILLCAFTGLVVGFVSLYLMQSVVTQMRGRMAGWLFVVAVAGLSSFGIYLGRFLRFNSWDVLTRPGELFQGVSSWVSNPTGNSTTLVFTILFAIFLFIAYLMLYALTRLPKLEHFSQPA